ncbi:hypothetical protein [uncultured Sanguibacteroides sp.]|uniref:hypothetical protein n=1 Tax=uncultured Sanguibacteroides sp. TaxID=1635151 RepID=UPI0025E248AC|nr:hypothetical protein [uncultured Sanguibacteroides sp.]
MITLGKEEIGKFADKVSSKFPVKPSYAELSPMSRALCNYGHEKIHPYDTLSIFIIHPDTLQKYEWMEIGEQKNTCENTRKRLKNLKTSTLMNIFSFILDKKNNQCLLNKYLQFGEGVIVMPSSYNPRK